VIDGMRTSGPRRRKRLEEKDKGTGICAWIGFAAVIYNRRAAKTLCPFSFGEKATFV
jgi:hypothetical protein